MRIRTIKPAFWRDKPIQTLPPEVRLFYIGLWMVADDAGWIEWDTGEIAADLYAYRSVRTRERQVERFSSALLSAPGDPRLILHACGHAVLPHLPEHQRMGGNRNVSAWEKHQKCGKVQTSLDKSIPVQTEGKVREGKGKEGKGREDAEKDSHLRVVDGEWVAS